MLGRTRDRSLHDEVAHRLSTWVREAGLVPTGAHALPAEVLLTMLRRVPSLDSERWPRLLSEMVGERGLDAVERTLRTEWLGARSLRASMGKAGGAGPRREPSITPRVDRAPLEAFAEVDDQLCRLPRNTLALPSFAIYDVVRATAAELSFSDWAYVARWPASAQRAAVDAIVDGEVRADAASEAAERVGAEDLFVRREIPSYTAKLLFVTTRRPRARRGGYWAHLDHLELSLNMALASHATAQWRELIAGLAESQNPMTRAGAADLLTSAEGPDALRCLDTLALDPELIVRRAAMLARSQLRIVAEDGHLQRLLLLTAMRGEAGAASERIARAADGLGSDASIRRTRYLARRLGLSPRAIAFVDDALPFRPGTMIGTPVREEVQLFTTDGHRTTTPVLFERERGDARVAFAEADVADFVRRGPSSFVRLEREGHPPRAIQVLTDDGARPRAIPADERLLGTIL